MKMSRCLSFQLINWRRSKGCSCWEWEHGHCSEVFLLNTLLVLLLTMRLMSFSLATGCLTERQVFHFFPYPFHFSWIFYIKNTLYKLLIKMNFSCWTTYSGWNGGASKKNKTETYTWSFYTTDFCHRKWTHKEKSILLLQRLFTVSGNVQCTICFFSLTHFFPKIFWMDTGTPSTDFEHSAFWVKFTNMRDSIFMSAHFGFVFFFHGEQGCSGNPLFSLWRIIIHWDLAQCSLYCRIQR